MYRQSKDFVSCDVLTFNGRISQEKYYKVEILSIIIQYQQLPKELLTWILATFGPKCWLIDKSRFGKEQNLVLTGKNKTNTFIRQI